MEECVRITICEYEKLVDIATRAKILADEVASEVKVNMTMINADKILSILGIKDIGEV